MKSRRVSMTKHGLSLVSRWKKVGSGPRQVARPVHVGQPEGDRSHAAEHHVVLAGGLRDRVAGVDRPQRVRERDRLLQRVDAVAERRLQVDEALDAGPLGGLHDVRRADARWCGRPRPRRAGSLYEAAACTTPRARSRERAVDERRVGDRALDHRQPLVRREAVAPGGGEVVDDEHLVAAASRRSARCEPMKPAPPVIRTLVIRSIPRAGRGPRPRAEVRLERPMLEGLGCRERRSVVPLGSTG